MIAVEVKIIPFYFCGIREDSCCILQFVPVCNEAKQQKNIIHTRCEQLGNETKSSSRFNGGIMMGAMYKSILSVDSIIPITCLSPNSFLKGDINKFLNSEKPPVSITDEFISSFVLNLQNVLHDVRKNYHRNLEFIEDYASSACSRYEKIGVFKLDEIGKYFNLDKVHQFKWRRVTLTYFEILNPLPNLKDSYFFVISNKENEFIGHGFASLNLKIKDCAGIRYTIYKSFRKDQKNYRNKGYGHEALILLLRSCFEYVFREKLLRYFVFYTVPSDKYGADWETLAKFLTKRGWIEQLDGFYVDMNITQGEYQKNNKTKWNQYICVLLKKIFKSA
jgi:hypothetical protein